MTTLAERIADLESRIEQCWIAAEMFLHNRDQHGIMDMGCEIAALVRCKLEFMKLSDNNAEAAEALALHKAATRGVERLSVDEIGRIGDALDRVAAALNARDAMLDTREQALNAQAADIELRVRNHGVEVAEFRAMKAEMVCARDPD